jgi:thermitase
LPAPVASKGLLCTAFLGLLSACSNHNTASPPLSVSAASATASTASAAPQLQLNGQSRRLGAAPGEYLVRFRAPTDRAYAASVLGEASFYEMHAYTSVPGLHRVTAGTSVNAQAAAARLAREPNVEYVEPNFYVRATATPDDP